MLTVAVCMWLNGLGLDVNASTIEVVGTITIVILSILYDMAAVCFIIEWIIQQVTKEDK